MAVFTIYKNFDFLIPDAPELIQTFMAAVSLLFALNPSDVQPDPPPLQESDTTSIRNAFVMLQAMAPSRAVEYFLSIYEQIPNLDEMMQLAVIELIRKESKGSSAEGALKVSSAKVGLRTRRVRLMDSGSNRRGTSSAFSSFSTQDHTRSSTRPRRLSLPSHRTPPPSRVSLGPIFSHPPRHAHCFSHPQPPPAA